MRNSLQFKILWWNLIPETWRNVELVSGNNLVLNSKASKISLPETFLTIILTEKGRVSNTWLNVILPFQKLFLTEPAFIKPISLFPADLIASVTKSPRVFSSTRIIGKPVLFFLVLVVFSGFFLSSLTTFVVVVVVLVVLVVVSSDESSSVESVSSSELVSVALSVELLSVELLPVPLPAADWSSEVWPFVLSD